MSGIVKDIKSGLNTILNVPKTIGTTIENSVDTVKSSVSNEINTIENSVSDVKNSVTNSISNSIDTVEKKFTDEYTKLKKEVEYEILYEGSKIINFGNKYLIPIGISLELVFMVLALIGFALVKIGTSFFPPPSLI